MIILVTFFGHYYSNLLLKLFWSLTYKTEKLFIWYWTRSGNSRYYFGYVTKIICRPTIHVPKNLYPYKGTFTRHSFYARHSKRLARGPIVSGTVRLIYTANHGQVSSMLISQTAPLKQNGTLKFVSPCNYMTAVHLWLHARFAGCWKRTWQILEYEEQLYGLLFWKTKTSVAIKSWDDTRSSLAPLLYKLKRLQYGLL